MATTNIKEVARRAGVSVGTVSNVLNRPEVVADDHPRAGAGRDRRARLRPQRLGPPAARRPQPDDRRSSCSTSPTRSSPTWCAAPRTSPTSTAPWWSSATAASDAGREHRHLDQLEEQRVHGRAHHAGRRRRDPRLEQLDRRGTPVVLVDRGDRRHDRCSVAVDDVLGGALAGAAPARAGSPSDRVRRRAVRHPAGRRPACRHRAAAVTAGGGSVTVVRTPSP